MNYFKELQKDLSEFTGIPLDRVQEMVLRKNVRTHTMTFEFINPKTREELEWFYQSNSAYLFALAKIKPYPNIRVACQEYIECNIRPSILDFGCGIGNNLLATSDMDVKDLVFIEKNMIQLEFIKWRIKKYSINKCYVNNGIKNYTIGYYDIIIMTDVIEHLYDYKPILIKLISMIKKQGLLFEHTPFGEKDLDIHIKDKHNLPELLRKLGMKRLDNITWKKI